MIIYGDVLFVLNLMLDYGLLLVTARIAGVPFVRLRLLFGALFGACYALVVFLPGCGVLSAVPVRLAVGMGMALIAYGKTPRMPRLLLILAAVTAALGGGVLALTDLGGATLYEGVATTQADFFAVVLIASALCAGLGVLFQRWGQKMGKQELAYIQVFLNGKSTAFRAMVDSGNLLSDHRNRGVIVVTVPVVQRLLPNGVRMSAEDAQHPSMLFETLTALLGCGRVQLISYCSVGISDGLMAAIRPDRVIVNGQETGELLLAVSTGPVSDTGAYEGLIGAEVGGAV